MSLAYYSFVTVYPDACLHSLFKDYKAHPCIDACPRDAIELRPLNINKDLCDGCGICASVCPTDALSLKPAAYKRLTNRATFNPDKKLTIHCSRTNDRSMEVVCLGMLEHGLLVELMSKGGRDIELLSGPCNSCEKKPGGDITLQNLERANSIMSLFGRKERVAIVSTEQLKEESEKGYTRREIFTGLGSRVSGFISDVTEMEDMKKWQRRTTTIKREQLLEVIEGLGEVAADAAVEGPLPFHGREISSLCDGCGGLWRCATFCPTGALSLSAEVIQNEVGISFEAGRCIDCKMCEMVCNTGAIKRVPVTAAQMNNLSGKESLISLEAGRCTDCGSKITGIQESLCPGCSQRESKMAWDIG